MPVKRCENSQKKFISFRASIFRRHAMRNKYYSLTSSPPLKGRSLRLSTGRAPGAGTAGCSRADASGRRRAVPRPGRSLSPAASPRRQTRSGAPAAPDREKPPPPGPAEPSPDKAAPASRAGRMTDRWAGSARPSAPSPQPPRQRRARLSRGPGRVLLRGGRSPLPAEHRRRRHGEQPRLPPRTGGC